MQNLSLVDETFDVNFTHEYILSILISQDGFSFCILDTIQNKAVCLYHQDTFTNKADFQQKKIRSIYAEVDLLELPYKKTILHYSSPDRTTLIPEKLFSDESLSSIYSTIFDSDKNSEILNTYIPSFETYALFGIQHPILSIINEKHPGINIYNDVRLTVKNHQPGKETLFVSIYRKQISIMFVGSSINFYNSYYYEGENDMLYYILGVTKSMNKQPSSVVLNGIVNKHSTIYHNLRQYFEQVSIAENNKNIHYSYLLEKLPDARFINLFNSFS